MNTILARSGNYFDTYFSSINVRKIELIILRVAVFSFLLHLLLIFLGNNFLFFENFQHSYLKAIYTPFSFILLYEVFLLVIIIPKSISEFVGKQFEVITLITLRSFAFCSNTIEINSSVRKQTRINKTMNKNLIVDSIASCKVILYKCKFHASGKRNSYNAIIATKKRRNCSIGTTKRCTCDFLSSE